MDDALSQLSALSGAVPPREPPTLMELRADLEREVQRVVALSIAGVSAAIIEKPPRADGYRASSARAPIASLDIRLRAGLSPGATMGLVVVWMAAMLVVFFIAIAAKVPATPFLTVVAFAGPLLLIAVPSYLLTRDRRIEMTATELRIHPPRALFSATPRAYSLDDVGPVHTRRPSRRGWTLVTVDQRGRIIELFSEVPTAVIDAELPRVMNAYRALTLADPS